MSKRAPHWGYGDELNAETMNEAVDAFNELVEEVNDLRRRVAEVEHVSQPVTEFFPAVITGNAAQGGTDRWKYAWSEIEFDGDNDSVLSGGRSGTTSTDFAINLAEMNHTATRAWGVETDGASYDTFAIEPRPVGGGGVDDDHGYDVPVWMKEQVDKNGNTRYYFFATGSHDGDCT